MERKEAYFDFEKLNVYQLALELADFIFDVCKKMAPVYRSSVVDQLQRAVVSIANNLAEGSGKASRREKIKYFAYSLDSTKECVPALTIAFRQRQLSEDDYRKSRNYCDSICKMLIKLIKSVEAQELSRTD